ncbi:MAG: hypothetical protein ACOC44_02660 [Promethearchaeia archaeon]
MVILIVKFILILYLGKNVHEQKKKTGEYKVDFLFSVFILVIFLFISRIFFTYFDFFLTEFDSTTYYEFPNYLYWKMGVIFSSIGIAFVLYIVDRKVFNFKFKGIFTLIVIAGALIILFIPINSPTDFTTASFLLIFTQVGTVLIPLMFIYIALKTPGLRKTALFIAIGFIFYGLAALLINESFVILMRDLFGSQAHIIMFFFFMVFKIIGLFLIARGVTQFGIK